jgi:hypothetical protein
MTIGQYFKVAAAVEASLTARGLLDASGNYTKPTGVILTEDVANVAADVAAALSAQGVVIDPKVDKILAALPTLMELASGALA